MNEWLIRYVLPPHRNKQKSPSQKRNPPSSSVISCTLSNAISSLPAIKFCSASISTTDRDRSVHDEHQKWPWWGALIQHAYCRPRQLGFSISAHQESTVLKSVRDVEQWKLSWKWPMKVRRLFNLMNQLKFGLTPTYPLCMRWLTYKDTVP